MRHTDRDPGPPGAIPRVFVDLPPASARDAAFGRSLWRLLPEDTALHLEDPMGDWPDGALASLNWRCAPDDVPASAGRAAALVWTEPTDTAQEEWAMAMQAWQTAHPGLTGLLRCTTLPEPGDHRGLESLVALSLQTGCPLTVDLHEALLRAHAAVRDSHAAMALVRQTVNQLPGTCVGRLEVGGQQHWCEQAVQADQRVPDVLWDLVDELCARWGPKPLRIKWQGPAPAPAVLADEARLAHQAFSRADGS